MNAQRDNQPPTKKVSYCYPSSPKAVELGFGAVGCWVVEVRRDATWPPQAFFGPDAEREAFEHAEAIPHPYSFDSHTPESRAAAKK